MMLPIAIHSDAEEDLKESYDWYEARREGLGGEFLSALEDAFEQILKSPLSQRKVVEVVRRRLVKRFPYIVFYRVLADRIEVVAYSTDGDGR